jgi:hypothetical protein
MAEESASAKFPVGYDVQANIFLKLDDIPDRPILDRSKVGFLYPAFPELVPRFD